MQILYYVLYRRMYRSLLALRHIAGTNSLCKQIALGTALRSKICKHGMCPRLEEIICLLLAAHSVLKKTTLVKKDPSVFSLWSSTQQLNVKQHDSLFAAIKNKFQLIQGPPGDRYS